MNLDRQSKKIALNSYYPIFIPNKINFYDKDLISKIVIDAQKYQKELTKIISEL